MHDALDHRVNEMEETVQVFLATLASRRFVPLARGRSHLTYCTFSNNVHLCSLNSLSLSGPPSQQLIPHTCVKA